jgi:hypothetical protein
MRARQRRPLSAEPLGEHSGDSPSEAARSDCLGRSLMGSFWSIWPSLYAVSLTSSALNKRQRGDYDAAIKVNEVVVSLSRRRWRPLRDDLRLLAAYIELFLCHLCANRPTVAIENGLHALEILQGSQSYSWRAFTVRRPTSFLGRPIADYGPDWISAFLRDLKRSIETNGSDEHRRSRPEIERILSELPASAG